MAVRDVEILITPLFETGIDLLTEGGAGLMVDLMPMSAVLFKPIIRGQIITAAKPPHGLLTGLFRHEDTHVGMGGGHIRVAGVDHQGNPHVLPASAGQFWMNVCSR